MEGKNSISIGLILSFISFLNACVVARASNPTEPLTDDRWHHKITMGQVKHDHASEPDKKAKPRINELPSLPIGTTTLKEKFDDWAVECRTHEATTKCGVGQYQKDYRTSRTIVAIIVTPPAEGFVKVVVLLPFGLAVTDGIRIRLDNEVAEQHGEFATCIPAGCLVSLILSAATIDAVEHADKIQIFSNGYESGSPLPFTISLRGFSAAFARLKNLQQAMK